MVAALEVWRHNQKNSDDAYLLKNNPAKCHPEFQIGFEKNVTMTVLKSVAPKEQEQQDK